MLFSIITPINKIPKTFKKCIHSLQKQSYKKFEWIIVLNGGLKKEDLPKIDNISFAILESSKNGPSAARNHGLKNSSGDYCIFLDSDDFLDDEFISILHAFVSTEKDYDCIGTSGFTFSDNNSKQEKKSNLVFSNHDPSENDILQNAIGSTTGFVVKNDINILFNPDMFFFEDFNFYIRCLNEKKKFYFLGDCKYFYFFDENYSKKYNLSLITSAFKSMLNDIDDSKLRTYQKFLTKFQTYRLYYKYQNKIMFLFLTILLLFLNPIFFLKMVRRSLS